MKVTYKEWICEKSCQCTNHHIHRVLRVAIEHCQHQQNLLWQIIPIIQQMILLMNQQLIQQWYQPIYQPTSNPGITPTFSAPTKPIKTTRCLIQYDYSWITKSQRKEICEMYKIDVLYVVHGMRTYGNDMDIIFRVFSRYFIFMFGYFRLIFTGNKCFRCI